MTERRVLFDVLIRPCDEDRVVAAVAAALGYAVPRVEFVDAAADDPSRETLAEQWETEHPTEPASDRRVRYLTMRVADSDVQAIAQTVLDVICPHGREEDARIESGERFPVTPDEFPWSAHVPVSRDDEVPADSPTVGTAEVRVTVVRWHWTDQPGWVEVELIDADGRAHRISDKVPVLAGWIGLHTPASDLPTELWLDADLVRAEDKGVTVSLRHGVETVDGLCVLTVPATAVRQTNVATELGG